MTMPSNQRVKPSAANSCRRIRATGRRGLRAGRSTGNNGHDVRSRRMLGMAWEDNFVKHQENGWRDLLKSLP